MKMQIPVDFFDLADRFLSGDLAQSELSEFESLLLSSLELQELYLDLCAKQPRFASRDQLSKTKRTSHGWDPPWRVWNAPDGIVSIFHNQRMAVWRAICRIHPFGGRCLFDFLPEPFSPELIRIKSLGSQTHRTANGRMARGILAT